jgi:hypothetical protein
MEQEITLGRQRVRFDRDVTVKLYLETVTVPDADGCGCASCKNFAAQRGTAYPQDFLELLRELGIDPGKEWAVFDYDFELDEKSRHDYGGWFVFCGEIVEGAEERPGQEVSGFAYWLTDFFPSGNFPAGVPVCAVEFTCQVPWILPRSSDNKSSGGPDVTPSSP